MHDYRDTADHDDLHGIESEPLATLPPVEICGRHNLFAPFSLWQPEQCEQCLIEDEIHRAQAWERHR